MCVCVCVCACMCTHIEEFVYVCVHVHACAHMLSGLVMSDSLRPHGLYDQVPLSIEFSRQEYWSGLPFPTPRDLPDPQIESISLVSPSLAGSFFTTEPPGKPQRN